MSTTTIASKVPKKRKASEAIEITNKHAVIGAPAQRTQSSRKGKKAWRKNVDIGDVEQGLEELREEERVVGGPIHKKADEDLFTIDFTGDAKIRQNVKTKKPLTATMILSQRSAVPPVFSRPNPARRITKEEKERLLRIGKRKRTGPFNAVVDPTQLGHGSAILEPSEAVKKSGTYDVWMSQDDEDVKVRQRLAGPEAEDFIGPFVVKEKIQIPTTSTRSLISVPAIDEPHQGTSYNPAVDSYKQLLLTAHQLEEKRVAEEEELEKIKEKMNSLRREVNPNEVPMAEGMILDVPDEDAVEDEITESVPVKLPARKTKQQRRKAEKVLAEMRVKKEKAERKKVLSTLERIKSLKAAVDAAKTEQERISAARKLERLEQLKKGLAGKRLGKHKVQESQIDVQLGDDLADSLRGLKVEGNLFRDRFTSMQNRALVEPRTRVFPTKRKVKVKELEKFAWKRFN